MTSLSAGALKEKKVRDTPLKYLNIFQKATGLPFHFQSAFSLCFA